MVNGRNLGIFSYFAFEEDKNEFLIIKVYTLKFFPLYQINITKSHIITGKPISGTYII